MLTTAVFSLVCSQSSYFSLRVSAILVQWILCVWTMRSSFSCYYVSLHFVGAASVPWLCGLWSERCVESRLLLLWSGASCPSLNRVLYPSLSWASCPLKWADHHVRLVTPDIVGTQFLTSPGKTAEPAPRNMECSCLCAVRFPLPVKPGCLRGFLGPTLKPNTGTGEKWQSVWRRVWNLPVDPWVSALYLLPCYHSAWACWLAFS